MKRCSRCDQWLSVTAFTVNRSRPDGLQSLCRDCQRGCMRDHYAANRDYYLAKAKRACTRRFRVFRKLLAELKVEPCADCGQRLAQCAMDFDHVSGVKLFQIGDGVGHGVRAILAEAAKCELVCANCHRDRTFRRLRERP